MDEQVIAAMARWPDVPEVFGWLSLNVAGQWRLHPAGDALSLQQPSAGEPIGNQQTNQFINRNYTHDAQGRWFFQNGPQRVYVRLDAAPYVFFTAGDGDRHSLVTHNGLDTGPVLGWYVDDAGHIYARTAVGPGLIAGRDLIPVLDALRPLDGSDLSAFLERAGSQSDAVYVRWGEANVCPLHVCTAARLPAMLGFVRHPQPGP